MFILSTADIPTCQLPMVLQIIYFGKLIFNILTVLLPIALILLVMIDFTKCLISGNIDNQKKVTNLAFKRIFYAVIVFAIPYVISLVMSFLSDLVPDYNLCLTNATPENIDVFTKEYEKEAELEEQERLNAMQEALSNSINDSIDNFNNNVNGFDLNNFENLMQSDVRWGSYPLCTNISRGGSDGRTIATSGCGFVSYTMVLRSYGYDIYPDDLVEVVCSELHIGTYGVAYWTDFRTLSSHYGLKTADLSVNDYSGMEKALHEGKRLIVLMPGHYISILGIRDDNTVIVGDSSRGYDKRGPYTMASLAKTVGYFQQQVIAIWRD